MASASYPNCMMKRCGTTRNGCHYSPECVEPECVEGVFSEVRMQHPAWIVASGAPALLAGLVYQRHRPSVPGPLEGTRRCIDPWVKLERVCPPGDRNTA
jgi:hypothetical protein